MYNTSSRNHNNTDDQSSQDADAATSQLIDSFFLPGGLFDPEDATSAALVSGKNEVALSTAYDASDNDSVQQTSRLDKFKRSSPIDYGDVLPHIPTSSSRGPGVHNVSHKVGSSDNSTATPAAGVGALDPNNDQVIVGGGSSRGRQVFDFHSSSDTVGQDSFSKVSSPKVGPNFDQDIDLGLFRTLPSASRSTTATEHSTSFPITSTTPKLSYPSAQSNTIENHSKDGDWYRQRSSNPTQTNRIQYSSYATNQPSNDFSSFFGSTTRSNQSSQNQHISPPLPPPPPPSSSEIKTTSSEHQNPKLNSNPWSNDDLVTLPTSASNQARYNETFTFMPTESKLSSKTSRTDYIQEYSKYPSQSHPSHPLIPFTSNRTDTLRAPPGFIASTSTSENSQIHTSEPIARPSISSSHVQHMTNSLREQERRMNYSAVASRNNPAAYHSSTSSQKQQQQQHQQQGQGQHYITNPNESNALSSYRDHQHPSPSNQGHSKTQYNNSYPIRKKSYTAVQAALQQEVDYDFRSQSSRDVPSTIYVEDDAISNSEDTLTVCADSVTVTSLPQNRSERFDMDVVEETSMTEQKKVKVKRNKKKKHKKKHAFQESVKSNDESNENESYEVTHDDDDENDMEDNDRSNSDVNEVQRDDMYYQEQSKLTRRNVHTKQNASRGSAATTAISSTATHHGHKATTKKKGVHSERSRTLDRKSPKETVPSKSFFEVVMSWLRHILPIISNIIVHVAISSVTFAKVTSKKCIGLFPSKDKFWFLLPMTCIISDFFFLMCAIFTKVVGLLVYVTVILHKLAFLELLDSDSAAMCYSMIYFYPSLMEQVTLDFSVTYQEYVPSLLRWFFVHTYLLRPIKMRDTYIYKVKQELAKMDGIPKGLLSRLFPPRVSITTDNIRVDISDRIVMANYILSILRKVAPLIIMLEMNIHRNGFLLYLTSTERILFGYGLSVLRTGYLFSPLIWISWTIQLTIIMFVSLSDSSVLDHCLLLLGLISIRMSHYTVAVEDLEGTAPHCNSTSSRRLNASYIANQSSN